MTILRPRQKQFVERSVAALHAHGNTLGVATKVKPGSWPTGMS